MGKVQVDPKLYEVGIELGDSLLKNCATQAADQTDFHNGLVVTQIAALHILATCAINGEIYDKTNAEDLAKSFGQEILQRAIEYREMFKKGHGVEYEIKPEKPKGTIQ